MTRVANWGGMKPGEADDERLRRLRVRAISYLENEGLASSAEARLLSREVRFPETRPIAIFPA